MCGSGMFVSGVMAAASLRSAAASSSLSPAPPTTSAAHARIPAMALPRLHREAVRISRRGEVQGAGGGRGGGVR